jgi:hypothetical protein
LLSIKTLLTENITPGQLAMAGALGVFLGSLPLIAVHTIAILFAAGYFRLNKVAALAASQLCMPPIVPALSATRQIPNRNFPGNPRLSGLGKALRMAARLSGAGAGPGGCSRRYYICVSLFHTKGSSEFGMRNAEWGMNRMRNAEWGVWIADCGLGLTRNSQPATQPVTRNP